jgi:hypothetical protein
MIGEVQGESFASKGIAYRSTPIYCIWEWYNSDKTDPKMRIRSKVLDYIILNPEVHAMNWLSGANWNPAIEHHHQMNILVISREDMEKYYSPAQAKSTEDYIAKKIIEDIENGKNPWIGKK